MKKKHFSIFLVMVSLYWHELQAVRRMLGQARTMH